MSESADPQTERKQSESFDLRAGLPGLTWRSLLALIYIGVCFQPGFAYLQLVTLSPVGFAVVQWATVILFMELSRLAGKPLTRQEIIIIFLGTVGASRFSWFLSPSLEEANKPAWLYQIYFAHSPAVQMFGLEGKIPWFYAPASEDPWIFRTFFHASWLPIAMNTAAFGIAAYVSDVCAGLIMYRLYVVAEKLPFPRAIPVVDACEALIEREWRRVGVLAVLALFSSVYSFLAYVFPLVTSTFWGQTIQIIPIPWVDISPILQVFIPAISFGVSTSLSTLSYGFIIPFKAALGMLIASIAIYMIGNPLLISYELAPGFVEEYRVGMSLATIWQRSFLHMWAMPLIGFGMAIGIIPLFLNLRIIRTAFSGLERRETRTLMWAIIPFIAATVGLSVFDYWLAPDAPIFAFLFINTIWLFISLLIRTRGMGLGVSFGIPYMREVALKTSGYTGINGWFVPTLFGGTGWAQDFKICDMTNTRKLDLILGIYVAMPVGLLVAFYYMQSFWSLAPIPSNVYPGALYNWPVLSTFQALFISPEASKYFLVERILYSFAIGSVLYLIAHKLGSAAIVVGMVAGIASPFPTSLTTFMGALAGLVLTKVLKEWWRKNVGLVIAGLVLGEGLITALGTSVIIIAKNIWALPF